jgi:hypothetical protein
LSEKSFSIIKTYFISKLNNFDKTKQKKRLSVFGFEAQDPDFNKTFLARDYSITAVAATLLAGLFL